MTRHGERLWLAVSVVPNARRSGADGLHDGALRVRLAAPPVDGKANEALLAWLAEALGLRRRDLALVRGQTARRKWVEIAAPPSPVIECVQRLLTRSSTGG
ncbi:MAG: DUF167 domain-containing protein [Proteobacteria bacterium]|nr:DUF167 domain-containing protein [Pseudomonadota bacterium]